MRVATNRNYGNPTVLAIDEVAQPLAGPDQILVRVHASAITQGDRRLRAGDFPGFIGVLGRLMLGVSRPRHTVGGSTFAGRVVAIGDKVKRFRIGDDVFGVVMRGAYADYLAVSETRAVATMPTNVGYAEAAAIPYGASTALVFLRDMAKVQPGERVLVVGASGGVGRMAVQVAKHLGAHVTGVLGRDAELVRDLGADEVIDYTTENFTETQEKWDVIFDTTQGNHFRAYRAALSAKGRYLSLYVTIRLVLEMAWTALRDGKRAMAGVALGGSSVTEDVRDLVEAGAVRAIIARRFSFDRIVEGHQALETGKLPGSVVVELSRSSSPTRLAV